MEGEKIKMLCSKVSKRLIRGAKLLKCNHLTATTGDLKFRVYTPPTLPPRRSRPHGLRLG